MLTGAQIRMARGYAKLSVKALAEASGVAESTLKRMELAEGVPPSSGTNLEKVKTTLESFGVQFLEQGDVARGPGIGLGATADPYE